MKAIIYGDATVAVKVVPFPQLQHGDDVLIDISHTGLCGTDLNVIKGKFPAKDGIVMGHEAVGVVKAVADGVQQLTVGDRVVIDPTMWCGLCERCRDGRHNQCLHKLGREVGLDFHGAFAEQAVFPERFIYKIPDEISFDQAVFAEPLACVLNNFNAANSSADSRVAIIGGGPIGALAAMYARRFFHKHLVLETDVGRAQALERIGLATARVERDAGVDLISAIINERLGGAPDLVIDTSGVFLSKAVEIIAVGGVIVPMGFNTEMVEQIRTQALVSGGIRITGGGDYNWKMQEALRLLPSLPVEDLITHRLAFEPFADRMRAMALGDYGNALKVLLETTERKAA